MWEKGWGRGKILNLVMERIPLGGGRERDGGDMIKEGGPGAMWAREDLASRYCLAPWERALGSSGRDAQGSSVGTSRQCSVSRGHHAPSTHRGFKLSGWLGSWAPAGVIEMEETEPLISPSPQPQVDLPRCTC